MKLIVGLGNPGRTYQNNRHNIGFICINYFAKKHGIDFDKKQGLARTGRGEVAGAEVILAKPQTYMNSSGESVAKLVQAYRLTPADLIVIYDDLDLPLGKLRIRCGGGSAGHKGVQSIIEHLGSAEFIRVRVGIGRPTQEQSGENGIIDYVLSDFTGEEKKTIAAIVPVVSEALAYLLGEGLVAAMNKFNG